MSVVTLANAKLAVGLDSSDTSQDTELQTFINAAENDVAELVGDLSAVSYTDVLYGFRGAVLYLKHCPVVAVTAASTAWYTGQTPTSLTPATDLIVDATTGSVRRADGCSLHGDVTIAYTSGYATLPASVERAVLEHVREHYQGTQQGGRPDDVDPLTGERMKTWQEWCSTFRRAPRVA